MARCPQCEKWHVRPDDLFCSACGKKLADFEFLDCANMIRVDRTGHRFHVRLPIKNTGHASVHLEIKRQAEQSLVANYSGLPVAVALPPGAEGELTFDAEIVSMPEDAQRAEIGKLFVESKEGEVYKPLVFFRRTSPKLAPTLVPPKGELYLNPNVRLSMKLELYNQSGEIVKVEFEQKPDWLEMPEQPIEILPLQCVQLECPIIQERVKKKDLERIVLTGEININLLAPDDTVACAVKSLMNYLPPEDSATTDISFQYDEYTRVKVPIPDTTLLLPPKPLVFRMETDGKRTPLKTTLDLGELTAVSRLRERFYLKNDGGGTLWLKGIHTSRPPAKGAFIVAVRELSGESMAITGECEFHVCVDGRAYKPGRDYTHVVVFEFENAEPLECMVRFVLKDIGKARGAVAIDFGTSNSCVAHCADGNEPARAIEIDGKTCIPSTILFYSADNYAVGQEAMNAVTGETRNSVSCIKRALLGAGREIEGRHFSPKELVTIMMHELISAAARNDHQIPSWLVVTVPVAFSAKQRSILKEAALEAAGGAIKNVMVVDEPSATAMHFCAQYWEQLKINPGQTKNILVYDFGGGTLDVSIVEVGGSFPVICSRRGEARLGGVDIDKSVAVQMAEMVRSTKEYGEFDVNVVAYRRRKFQAAYGRRGGNTDSTRYAFRHKAEEVKIALSYQPEVKYDFQSSEIIGKDGNIIQHNATAAIASSMTQEQLKKTIEDDIQRSINVIENALWAAGKTAADIDVLLLTGQISNIPYLRKCVRALFPDNVFMPGEGANGGEEKFDVKTCVSLGAAKLAFLLSGKKKEWADKSVGSIGYFDTTNMFQQRFVSVLPDGHPYGKDGDQPIRWRLDDMGRGLINVHENQGPHEMQNEDRRDFKKLGEIHFHFPERKEQFIDVYLGLDDNGQLRARIDNQYYEVEAAEPEADEEW